MSDTLQLTAYARERSGTGGARATRREGKIPAILYGGKEPPMKIALVDREIRRELTMNPHFFTSICELAIDGKTMRALPREAQLHPVNDLPLHLDFIRIGRDTVVTVSIPMVFLDEEECPGLRAGGVLNIVRHDVEVSCPAEEIPAQLEVSLKGRAIGDSIHISEVTLPANVTPTTTDRDFTVATIAAPTLMPTEDEADTATTETTEMGPDVTVSTDEDAENVGEDKPED